MSRSRSRSVNLSAGEPSSPTSGSRSNRSQTPGLVAAPSVVITSPPWARDETPSPEPHEVHGEESGSGHPSTSRLSVNHPHWDTASTDSNATERPGSRWWVFTRPRNRPSDTESPFNTLGSIADKPDSKGKGKSLEETQRIPMRERLPSTAWFVDSADRWRNRSRRQTTTSEAGHGTTTPPERADGGTGSLPDLDNMPTTPPNRTSSSRTKPLGFGNGLHIDMPPTPDNAFMMHNSQTPGWTSPWAPYRSRRGLRRDSAGGTLPDLGENEQNEYSPFQQGASEDDGNGTSRGLSSPWKKRKMRIRQFILNNGATPLILRLANLLLTTTTLGVAVRERRVEIHNGVLGVVGSSITLNIIFAPLTIIHVLIAVYLEYFGRPLGLWQTSWKLIHTLSETVFICLWSAALSLTFDNFFTSDLRCAPRSSTAWWNSLPPDPNPLGSNVEHSVSDDLCHHTLALIVLVFLGLMTYCSSLFVSLFRIFEKVKYQTATRPPNGHV